MVYSIKFFNAVSSSHKKKALSQNGACSLLPSTRCGNALTA